MLDEFMMGIGPYEYHPFLAEVEVALHALVSLRWRASVMDGVRSCAFCNTDRNCEEKAL